MTVRNENLSAERKRKEREKRGTSGLEVDIIRNMCAPITKVNINTHHDGDALCRDDYVATHASVYRDHHRLVGRGLYGERQRGPCGEGWVLLYVADGLHQ